MTNPLRNLGYSLRRLRKNPGLTIVILLTLALGIGANTAMFTVDYASMIAPIPYPDPDQLVVVWSKIQDNRASVSPADFLDWRRQSSAFQALDACTFSAFNISTQDQPQFFQEVRSTAGFFRHRGIKLYLGRDFLPEEEQAGKDHVVVLGNRLWKRLGSDPNVLGKSVRLDNLQDVRYGLRMLRKSLGLTLVAVLSLGLGIGANTAIFSLLDAVMLRSLPVQDPGRLFLFGHGRGMGSADRLPNKSSDQFSYPFYREIGQKIQVFTGVTAVNSVEFSTYCSVTGSPLEGISADLVRNLFLGPRREAAPRSDAHGS